MIYLIVPSVFFPGILPLKKFFSDNFLPNFKPIKLIEIAFIYLKKKAQTQIKIIKFREVLTPSVPISPDTLPQSARVWPPP